MYDCTLCGGDIRGEEYEELDEQADDMESVVCRKCLKTKLLSKDSHVRVIAKTDHAALVMIQWRKEDDDETSDERS